MKQTLTQIVRVGNAGNEWKTSPGNGKTAVNATETNSQNVRFGELTVVLQSSHDLPNHVTWRQFRIFLILPRIFPAG
jgi:hypothetical protein